MEAALQALQHTADRPCLILHGSIASGKTRTASRLARSLAARGVSVGGILAPRLLEHGETVGYEVEDLRSGQRRPLASLRPPGVPAGRYFLSRDGLAFARDALGEALEYAEIILIDEVGRLELDGGGHAAGVRAALEQAALPVLVVRSEWLGEVCQRFAIEHAVAVQAAERRASAAADGDGAS